MEPNLIKIKNMKKALFVLGIATAGLLFMNFSTEKNIKVETPSSPAAIEIPDNVQEILDNSCYGCHNSDSKNLKGKKKLSFDKLNDLKTYKAIGKLTDVAESVTENDMPPKKTIKKYPEMALTDAQKETLIDWAKSTAEGLAGE